MAERAGSSLGYITSKALDGDWSPKEVSMETAAFANRHVCRVGDHRNCFPREDGLHRGQQMNISRYRSNFE